MNFLVSTPKWIVFYYLKDKDIIYQILITSGVLYTCSTFAYSNPSVVKKIISEFGWFSYVKRFSLLAGFFGYIFMYFYRKNISTKIFQWILTLNVLEAGILGIRHKDYLIGVLLVLLSPFSPEFKVNDKNTIETKSGSIIPRWKPISDKNYFRAYLSLLGILSFFGNYFIERKLNIFAGTSCLIPLIINEIEKGNYGNNFSIRTFSIIIASIIDSTVSENYINKTSINLPFLYNSSINRNVIHGSLLVLYFLITY